MESSGYQSLGGGTSIGGVVDHNQRNLNLANSATFSRTNIRPIYNTPKHNPKFKQHETMTFGSVGMSVLLKTDYPSVSSKRLFSHSGGLGANKGSLEWEQARLKKERMAAYVRNIQGGRT